LWTSILPPPDTTFVTTSQRLALSPEGTRVAFLALNRQGRSWLWVRDLSEPSVRAIAETDSFATPFWSPDGKTLAFGAGRKLRRLDLATGAVHDVCDAPRMRGGAWNRRGDIVFAPLTSGAIHRVPASGGAPAAVTRLDLARGEYSHRWPSFLPDGRHFLFLAQARTEAGQSADVYIGAIDGGAPRLLLRDASNAEYVSSGHIVFARQGSLLAAPFDPNGLAITGEPLLVSRDVRYMKPSELSAFSAASNGTLAYLTSPPSESRLQWLDRSGKTIEEVEEQAGTMLGSSLRLSRDGRAIAFVRLDAQSNGHLWIHDRRLRTTTRVISEPRYFQGVAWSPDGSRLVSSSVQTGDIREKAVARADEETVLLKPLSRSLTILDWSPDGRSILFLTLDPATGWDVWALPHGPGGEASPILRTPFSENDARVSPDGRWLAYSTDESGRTEVYVSAFPLGDGRRWPVSAAGGRRPTWGKDGRELYYFSPDGKLMVVDVQPGTPVEFSSPRALFDFPRNALDFERFTYDAAPDGQRFLVHLPHGREAPTSMTLVSNWTEGLVR